ncbi:MAG: energy-coupling factor transporter transmembrane component T [Solirubrobacterales bacterium]
MIAALTYVPRRTPLARAGVLAASAYLGAFAAVAFAFSHPVILAADAAAVVIAGLAAGTGRALAASLRFAAALGVLMVAANAVASQRGDTILVRGPGVPVLGTVNVSAEALAEGGVLALRVAIVIAAFAVFTAAIDPDRVLRLLRPIARRSALTATLVVRLVPLAAADHARLRDAASLRGPAAAPVSRPVLVRRLVAGSLDRSVDAAATLELRGYGRGAPGRARRAPRSTVDAGLWLVAIATVAVSVVALVAGAAPYDSYPSVDAALEPLGIALAISLPVLAVLPALRKSVSR